MAPATMTEENSEMPEQVSDHHPHECPVCQTVSDKPEERTRRQGSVYYVDVFYPACGHLWADTEGGV